MFSFRWPDDCDLVIQGTCNFNRFEAGIERFYVPEEEASKLEELVRKNEASILLSVPKNGQAQIKDLLISGVSWRKVVN